ncbi:YkvA family protein [Actinoallomurus sp. CA-150999]|uniref:YkvA family protein n=1 Tax=Actinoallomurus sp. CA-150999 TaxID=3239887 RepID=UPI003D9172C2
MAWLGALVLFVGAILTFAVGGDVGTLDVRTVGIVGMAVGGVLLVVGIVRLRRTPRPTGARSSSGVIRGGVQARVQEQMYRTSKGKIIAMIAVVIYILSPVDLIPDVFLPVGIIDDGTAFAWLLFAIGQEVTRKRRSALAARER